MLAVTGFQLGAHALDVGDDAPGAATPSARGPAEAFLRLAQAARLLSAHTLMAQGRMEEGHAATRQVLAEYRRLLGDQHPLVGRSWRLLAHGDCVLGRFAPCLAAVERAEAIVREIHEELDLPIDNLRLLGTLESLFVYNDKPGHEIVMVYDGQFTDPSRYEQPHLDGQESNGAPFRATWQGSASFTDDSPLVPQGLQSLLNDAGLLD